ncbi:MAG: hypothetical protein ABF629_08695 [Sporolactobacillus sp.]
MNQEATRRPYEMRLSAMVEAITAQETNENCCGMNFNDRFEVLVDTAYAAWQSNKLENLIKPASFKTIEPSFTNIDYLPDRQLDQ